MKHKKTIKTVSLLLIVSIISKIFGLLREMFIAKYFGISENADAYFIAIVASTILFFVIGLSLNTVIIPIISEMRSKYGLSGENRYVSNILGIVFIFTIILTILGYVSAPILIKILASGFKGDKYTLAVSLTRIGLPVMIFNGGFFVFKGFLHVHKKFLIPAIEGIINSIPLILYLLLFSEKFGVNGLIFMSVVSSILIVILMFLSSVNNGFRYVRVLNLKDPEIQKTLIIIGPIILGALSGYINTIVDRTFASRMIEGSVSALTYAAKIQELIRSLTVVLFVTVLYPIFSEHAAADNTTKLVEVLSFGLKSIALITLPSIAVIAVLKYPLVRLMYQRGSFNSLATQMTSHALFYYSFGILGIGIFDLISRVFYSMKDSKTPMIISLFTVGLNIVLNLLLSKVMGFSGLALATSISVTVSALILLIYLNKKIPEQKLGITGVALKAFFSALIMGIFMYYLNEKMNISTSSLSIQIIKVAAIIFSGFLIYLIQLYLLKVNEIYSVLELIKTKLSHHNEVS